MKSNKKQTFSWQCCLEKLYGKVEKEHCIAHSRKPFATAKDAAASALRCHSKHSQWVYIISSTKGYIGLATGINFNK